MTTDELKMIDELEQWVARTKVDLTHSSRQQDILEFIVRFMRTTALQESGKLTSKITSILDAAVDVSCFARDHKYPAENTPEFSTKLDALRTALRRVYPNC